jgi:hypothetical protein
MRTMNRTGVATTVTVGAVCMMLLAPSVGDAQIIIPTNPQLPRIRAYKALDLGVAGDAGALNNQAGVDVTATFEVRRFIQGVQRNIPVIHTIDDACRDRMDIDDEPGIALSINDSRIVVGRKDGDAFEWFPSQCPNVVQLGSLPRLPSFLGAQANANNGTRDAVGFTSIVSQSLTIGVPTVWRKVNDGFTVQQLQTAFRPAPLNNVRQPGAAFDINEDGTIVGFTRVGNEGFNRAAILHENQDPDILRLFGASDAFFRPNEARGISNNGYITGTATRVLPVSSGGVQTRGFVRSPGGTIRGTLIPDINGTYIGSFAHKVNNDGLAVGRLIKNDGGSTAALWNEDGEVAMLDTSNVDGLPQGAVLTEALDINDHGAILAKGLVDGELHVFILRVGGGLLIFRPASQSY